MTEAVLQEAGAEADGSAFAGWSSVLGFGGKLWLSTLRYLPLWLVSFYTCLPVVDSGTLALLSGAAT